MGLIFVRLIGVGQCFRDIAQNPMKKRFSIVSELSAKRFAKLHSDWPKRLFVSQAPVRGHKN